MSRDRRRWLAIAAASGALALVIVGYLLGRGAAAVAMAALVFGLPLFLLLRLQRRLRLIARSSDGERVTSVGAGLRALEAAVARLAEIEREHGQRNMNRHTVTALPTREPLFARIAADGAGRLGVVEFGDYERLFAFDENCAQQALEAFAERLRRVTGASVLLAHVDRARFAVWYPHAAASTKGHDAFAAVDYAMRSTITVAGDALIPLVRTATVSFPEDAGTPALLLSRAFAAFGQGAAHDPIAAARDDYGLEQDLRAAITRQELSLEFQPLIDAAAMRVCGAEALLRWQHPVQGRIAPTQFVPVMEQVGLASEIGSWVLDRALREARGWASDGLAGLRVAVNVSGHQLDRSGFGEAVARALTRHGLDPSALEIELTETTATGASGRHLFNQLRALGVAIAIDDFGTGFSSLSTLRSLRFDKIKIDREFVTLVDRRADSQAICRSILALGHGLGIGVLAEGVERPEEYAWLRRHGCSHFQGYYFSKPLPPRQFRAFLSDRAGLMTRLGEDFKTRRLRA